MATFQCVYAVCDAYRHVILSVDQNGWLVIPCQKVVRVHDGVHAIRLEHTCVLHSSKCAYNYKGYCCCRLQHMAHVTCCMAYRGEAATTNSVQLSLLAAGLLHLFAIESFGFNALLQLSQDK